MSLDLTKYGEPQQMQLGDVPPDALVAFQAAGVAWCTLPVDASVLRVYPHLLVSARVPLPAPPEPPAPVLCGAVDPDLPVRSCYLIPGHQPGKRHCGTSPDGAWVTWPATPTPEPPAPATLGELAHAWRVRLGYFTDEPRMMAKVTEEVGEFASALVGEWEDRPDRGDPEQEAAQVVILLAALVHGRGRDLLAEVTAELKANGIDWPVLPASESPAPKRRDPKCIKCGHRKNEHTSDDDCSCWCFTPKKRTRKARNLRGHDHPKGADVLADGRTVHGTITVGLIGSSFVRAYDVDRNTIGLWDPDERVPLAPEPPTEVAKP